MSTTTTPRKARTPRKPAAPKATTPEVEAAEPQQPQPQPEPQPEAAPEAEAEESAEEIAAKLGADQEPDYTYLADKPPSELHERMAAWLTERTGVEISPKQAQVVMSMRQAFRTSETGREIVEGRHTAAAEKRAKELAAKKATAAKKIAELQAILDAK